MYPPSFLMVCQQGAQSSPSPTLCQSQERNLRRLLVHLGPYTTCNFQSSNHRGSRCSTQHDSRKLSRLVLPQTLLRTGRARQTARKVQLQSELSDSACGSVWRRDAAFGSFLQPLIAWARPLTPGKSRNRTSGFGKQDSAWQLFCRSIVTVNGNPVLF
jgi:hypothetical protein